MIARLEHQAPRLFHLRRPRQGGPEGASQDVAALEVAPGRDPVPLRRDRAELGARRRGDLGGVPHVEATLFTLGVGVLGRAQSAPRRGQLGEHVADGLLDHLDPARLSRDLPGVEVGAHQPGLVVEHLLEVRHRPGVVGGVARETAAEMVVDPAGGHRPQSGGGHGERRGLVRGAMVAQAQLHQLGLGELRRGPETAPGRSRSGRRARPQPTPGEPGPGNRRRGCAPGESAIRSWGRRVRRSMASANASACRSTSSRRLFQTSATASSTRRKLGVPGRSARGKYVPPKKGRPSGGEKHRHRPPAAPGHGLDRLHVDGVHVGTLFTIDLHRHEPGVELVCGRVVLEGLVGHDVAPVARGVPDRQEDGTVLGAGLFEGLVTPGVPVDRIVRVLAEVGARLRGQSVHPCEPTAPTRVTRHIRGPAGTAPKRAEW